MNLYFDLAKPEKLIDSHCHLNSKKYSSDLTDILKNAELNEVNEIWDVSTTIESSKRSVSISKYFKKVRSFVGIDPEVFVPGSDLFVGLDIDTAWLDFCKTELTRLINLNRDVIVGIGETGLDHYWTTRKDSNLDSDTIRQSHKLQERLFRLHLELAQEYNMPLTIHSRNAEERCLEIVRDYNCFGIFHSYTGNLETALGIVEAGWGLGVNGIITFRNAGELRDMFKTLIDYRKKGRVRLETPEDFYRLGIYFETDGPYLSPEGKRGERNEPKNVKTIFEEFKRIVN